MSVVVSSNDSRTVHQSTGRFEAIICTQCGYTEWYAHQLEWLRELVKSPTSGVRLIDSEPGSPYR